jgi:hypothetical protein
VKKKSKVSKKNKKKSRWEKSEESEEDEEEISDMFLCYNNSYSITSENQRANVRVQFAKSTDLYKNLFDEKVQNDSFENEHQLDNKNSKVFLKKVCDTPMSVSTNLTTLVSDSYSENRMKTSTGGNNNSHLRDKKKKYPKGKFELGTISEETKKAYNNNDSDNYSESSNR